MNDRPRLNLPTLTRAEPEPIEQHRDGHAEAPPTGGVRGSMIANRTPWLDLPEPFDNLEIRAWLDFPQETADLWSPQDGETREQAANRLRLAVKATFLDHRGENGQPWMDEQGVLPGPHTDEFWDRIPTQLTRAIIDRFTEELTANPTSRASRKWKRKHSRRR